jgi:penicillin-binding protein 2
MFRGIQRVLGSALTVDRAGFSERFPEIVTGTGGVRVTPTDMAGAMVSLVSGMAPASPSYELERRSEDERSALVPARERRPGRFPTAGTIRRALAAAVAEGPALGTFRDLPVSVAGKSASVVHSDASLPPDAWFVGYAPVRTPVFAVACWIEGGGSGLRKAAPAVRNMLREMTAP